VTYVFHLLPINSAKGDNSLLLQQCSNCYTGDSWIFATPLKFGLKSPMPTTDEDIINLKKEFSIIGNELKNIYHIIQKVS
jgi:hypothetical protein